MKKPKIKMATVIVIALLLAASIAQAYTQDEAKAAYEKVCNTLVRFNREGRTAKIIDCYVLWLQTTGCEPKGWTSEPSTDPVGIEIVFMYFFPDGVPGFASWVVTSKGDVIPKDTLAKLIGEPIKGQ